MTDLSRLYEANFERAVQALINQNCIVDYGIIQKVVAKGIVTVASAVATNKSDVKVMNCVYAGIAGSNLSIDIVPEEGDKVLLIYPRRFSPKMFSKDEDKTILNEDVSGYSILGGIALPVCQFRTSDYKNYIKFDKDKVELKLAYSKDEDKNLITLDVDAKGYLKLDSNKNIIETTAGGITVTDCNSNKVAMTSNGVTVTDCNNNKVEMTSSAVNISCGQNGTTIEMSSSEVKINDKLTVKKE